MIYGNGKHLDKKYFKFKCIKYLETYIFMPNLIEVDMKADIKGIISGLSLSEDKVLFPIFEAVVNSIQAIDERRKNEKFESEINIKIVRYNKQTEIGDQNNDYEKSQLSSPINYIEVVDNGIGLNTSNFGSFNTAHSTKKIKIGGMGLGRFSMLSVFEKIEIESVFKENGRTIQRKILFTDEYDEEKDTEFVVVDSEEEVKTKFTFSKIRPVFYKISAMFSHEKIADQILEHCLLYFLQKNAPKITIEEDGVMINLSNQFNPKDFLLFEKPKNIKKHDFVFYIVKDSQITANEYSLAAHNRRVRGKKIEKILPIFKSKIIEDGQSFFINIYVTSKFLDSRVTDSRDDIKLDKNSEESQLNLNDRLSEEDIQNEIKNILFEKYGSLISERQTEVKNKVNSFLRSDDGLSYRWLEIDSEILNSIPNDADEKKLDDIFHDHQYRIGRELRKKREKLLKRDFKKSDYRELFNEIVPLLTSENNSKLAQYVSHRKVIIDLLEKYLESVSGDKEKDITYEEESTLHNLFFTMGGTEKTVSFENHNLWLIDERLSFHTYIRSDIAQNKHEVIKTDSIKEPDIAIYDVNYKYGETNEYGELLSVVFVEFKRPNRSISLLEYNKQMMEQVKGLGKGTVNSKGKNMEVLESTPIYLYYICDVNAFSKLKDDAINFGGFKQSPYKSLMKMEGRLVQEILTYDSLAINARRKNLAFFKKLGI